MQLDRAIIPPIDKSGGIQRCQISINFAKAKAHSHAHNVREDEPKYLLPEERRMPNEFWQNELKLSAKEMFDQEVAAAKPKGGRKPSFESSHWEAVLNFNPEHTIEDVRRVAEHIEAKFGIKCVEIAMHKDEGISTKRPTRPSTTYTPTSIS